MITSTSNAQIKRVRQLQTKAKVRRQEHLFVVEGLRLFLETPKELCRQVYVTEAFCAQHPEISGEVVTEAVMKAMADTATPQGILALVEMPHYTLDDLLAQPAHLLLAEDIQDPGNLGTMFRTGEGAGITGIVLNKGTVDLFHPKTVRSTMGSIYRVPFVVAEHWQETLQQLKEKNVKLYAAHLQGTQMYDTFDYRGNCGFLIGNEGNGLSAETAAAADAYLRIPMEGKLESLNAAMAAGLLMYEVHRQRRV